MLGLLRFIRGFFGFWFALQALHVIEALAFLATSGSSNVDIGKFFAILLIKLTAFGISGFLFFWLRGFINRLNIKKGGVPHPALAQRKWAL